MLGMAQSSEENNIVEKTNFGNVEQVIPDQIPEGIPDEKLVSDSKCKVNEEINTTM